MSRRKKKRKHSALAQRGPLRRLPKLCGSDVELANFVVGSASEDNTCHEASRALLHEIEGLPRVSKRHALQCHCQTCRRQLAYSDGPANEGNGTWRTTYTRRNAPDPDHPYSVLWGEGRDVMYDPQDWGRKFLATNGGCAYIDLGHLELCIPEVLSARDHVAAWHAMLKIASRALTDANAKLPSGRKVLALVNNSDGLSNSYGSHLNFLITREAWERLFHRKLQQLLFLAAYQASSIVFAGQGKVGSENGMPPVDFQLSQRADFFEILTGEATTFRRPMINGRDEPLCGPRFRTRTNGRRGRREMARLHVIFYDSTLCHVASFLKVGVMQIILAMIEAECIDPRLTLEDPLAALAAWSHDPTLSVKARTSSGQQLTAVELQLRFLEDAARFAERGGCSGIVPGFTEVLRLWEDTLLKLRRNELDALARRLDWVLKLQVLRRAMEREPRLSWQSPELKHLDQVYGSLDRSEGLYWVYERAGRVDRVVPEERIDWFVDNPPENTRAWTRAMLLRRVGTDLTDDVNWDRVRVGSGDGRYRTVDLPNPLGHTKTSAARLFQVDVSINELLDALGAPHEDPYRQFTRRTIS